MTLRTSKAAFNIREKLKELEKTSGIAGRAMLAADTVADQQSLLGVGRKNRIINGRMAIDQRAITLNNNASVDTSKREHSVDRWRTYHYNLSGNFDINVTTKQHVDSPTSPQGKCIRVDVLAAGTPSTSVDFLTIEQGIEGYNCFDLVDVPMSLSFWVKTSSPGVYGIQMRASGGVGSSTVNYCTTYEVGGANVWQKIELAIPPQTIIDIINTSFTGYNFVMTLISGLNSNYDSGVAAVVDKWGTYASDGIASTRLSNTLGSAINNYFQFTEVQLERGSVATPFEYRSYGEELTLCKRYAQVFTGRSNKRLALSGNGGNTSYPTIVLPVEMRGNPAITYSALSDFDVEGLNGGKTAPTVLGLNVTSTTAVTLSCTTTGITGSGTNLLFSNSTGWMLLSAEL